MTPPPKDHFTVPVTDYSLPPDGLYPCRCRIYDVDITDAILYLTTIRRAHYKGVYVLQNRFAGAAPARLLAPDTPFVCSWSISFYTAAPARYALPVSFSLAQSMKSNATSGLELLMPVCGEET